jgi:acetylornithine deacetylase/succinyl-diaminopimelate desuccinylase-like protein
VTQLLKANGVESKTFETAPGRGCLVARYRGNGSQRPILLMAHVDTVDVDRDRWEVDPLGAVVKDGYMYGRGVVDDKGMAACALAVLLRLTRDKPELDRDLIVLLCADEEAGGDEGIRWMIRNAFDEIRAEYCLNEGGLTVEEGGQVQFLAIQCTEKTMHNVRLISEGKSGHSSVPHPDNALIKLGEAFSRVGAYKSPVRINEVNSGFFLGRAQLESDQAMSGHLSAISSKDPARIEPAAEIVGQRDPIFNALLRSTVTPTLVTKGGVRFNVIPSRVEGVLNVRLMPGDSLETFMADLERHIGIPGVRLEAELPMDQRDVDAPVSPVDSVLCRRIEASAKARWPKVVVMPYMSTGATDSRYLRLKGIASYGLLPMPLTREDLSRMHGDNERIPVQSIREGEEFLYDLLLAVGRN